MWTCGKCQAQNWDDARRCHNCGSGNLSGNVPTASPERSDQKANEGNTLDLTEELSQQRLFSIAMRAQPRGGEDGWHSLSAGAGERESSAAVERLHDSSYLGRIAMRCPNEFIREEATRKLTDQAALADIAAQTSIPRVALAAIERMADQELLYQVATQGDLATGTRGYAAKKIRNPRFLLKLVKIVDDCTESEWSSYDFVHCCARQSLRAVIPTVTDRDLLVRLSKREFYSDAGLDDYFPSPGQGIPMNPSQFLRPDNEELRTLARSRLSELPVPAEYKLRILREADACESEGALQDLLDREGLFWLDLDTWRNQRDEITKACDVPEDEPPVPGSSD